MKKGKKMEKLDTPEKIVAAMNKKLEEFHKNGECSAMIRFEKGKDCILLVVRFRNKDDKIKEGKIIVPDTMDGIYNFFLSQGWEEQLKEIGAS